MTKIKLNKRKDYAFNELVLSPKTWEESKKKGDKELYKKYNKYANYTELRIHINENNIDAEAHCIEEK